MKEIFEFIAVMALFIFFFYFLYKIYLKSAKKEDKRKEAKPVKEISDDKKEDVPEILKEVTLGNYMHDISKNINVEMPKISEENSEVDAFDIDKVFDNIDNQDLEDVEIEEIEDDLIAEISVDDVLLEDDDEIIRAGKNKSLAQEYADLSGNMKALIIANILEKQHHND